MKKTVRQLTLMSGVAPVIIERTVSAVLTVDGSEFTFSAVPYGPAFSGRKIVAGIGFRENIIVTVSSVTIGGVAASAIAGAAVDFTAGSLSSIAFYQATVPTGDTGDIVVTLSGSTLRCALGVWSLRNARTVIDTGTSTADPAADTLITAGRGVVLGYGFETHNAVGITAAWTGLTENFDAQVEGNTTHTGASAVSAAGGTLAISCDWSSTPATGGAAAFVSFGP